MKKSIFLKYALKALVPGMVFLCVLLWVSDKEGQWSRFYQKPVYLSVFTAPDSLNNKYIITCTGFAVQDAGLGLPPASSGEIVFCFNKKEGRTALLRVWFYGDDGTYRPNGISVSCDGKSYTQIAPQGNYVNAVFDLSEYVAGCSRFFVRFYAQNKAPFAVKFLDRMEVVAHGIEPKPPLPGFSFIAICLTVLSIWFIVCFRSRPFVRADAYIYSTFMVILLLGAYARWAELVNVAGTSLCPDAQGYFAYAQKMKLFTEAGFYSAAFGSREPLFLFIVKLFLHMFGPHVTHIRFVSLFFSIIIIALTFAVGLRWIHPVAALAASAVVAAHPYFIELSAQGLRAEWFTFLLLLLIYFGYASPHLSRRRVVICGFIIGAIVLSRIETIPMLLLIMLLSPILTANRWNMKMVLCCLLIGAVVALPHLYSSWKKYGTPFYGMKRHTVFYRNLEFMGKPGFPSVAEIQQNGMYTGPSITPWEYYFKLHTVPEVVKRMAGGTGCIYGKMTLLFAQGTGNVQFLKYRYRLFMENPSPCLFMELINEAASVFVRDLWRYCTFITVLLIFFAGLVFALFSPYRMLYVFLLAFQLQTAFIACLGIDYRLTVHGCPIMAFFCGYGLYRLTDRLRHSRFGRRIINSNSCSQGAV